MDSCNFVNRVKSHTPKVEVHRRPKLCHFGVVRAKLFCLKCFVPVTGLECSYGKISFRLARSLSRDLSRGSRGAIATLLMNGNSRCTNVVDVLQINISVLFCSVNMAEITELALEAMKTT